MPVASALVGAGVGMGLTVFQINQNNKALAEQAEELNRQNEVVQKILSTQQEISNIDAYEAVGATRDRSAEVQREVRSQITKAEGQVVAARGTGITGGASVARSMMDVASKGTKAETRIISQSDQQVATVFDNLRATNAKIQADKIKSNISTYNSIEKLKSQQVKGTDMLLASIQGGIGTASAAANLSNAISSHEAATHHGVTAQAAQIKSVADLFVDKTDYTKPRIYENEQFNEWDLYGF